MGFFSDLKEDLSQAVNELIPEEKAEEQEKQQQPSTGELEQLLTGKDEPAPAEAAPAAPKAAPQEPAAEAKGNSQAETIPEKIIKEEEVESGMTDTLESLLEKMDAGDKTAPAHAEQKAKKESKPKTVKAEPAPKQETPAQAPQEQSDETAIVTAGMVIKGDISSDGSLDVFGTIEGNINISGKLNVSGVITGNSRATEIYAERAKIAGEVRSDGNVKVGQNSVIIGNIFAKGAVVAGAVKGDIDVVGPVVLDASAIVVGNVKSKSVQINNGAMIEGMCSQCYSDVDPTSFFDAFSNENEKVDEYVKAEEYVKEKKADASAAEEPEERAEADEPKTFGESV